MAAITADGHSGLRHPATYSPQREHHAVALMNSADTAVSGFSGLRPRRALALVPPPETGLADVRLSLLGPIRVWRGDVELNVGPPQQRAVLALLVVRANRLVPISDMVELLWEQDPPGSAVNTIHKYIGCIRRLLEPGLGARAVGRWLTRHGDAYRLAADESVSDVIAFRRMVEDARSARLGGRPADAWDLLWEALALGRGSCGEGLELRGRGQAHFTAVDREYAAAIAEAADCALACGQAPRILPMLRQAASDEPLNESLQARLMLVLAVSGQQAQALSHYQSVRERLNEELGVDPGADLCTAHNKVLRQEYPAVRKITTTTGADTADIAKTASAGDTSRPPSGPVLLVPPAQLPADLPTFAGRESELSFLSGVLRSAGRPSNTVAICAISGMPGIGKTAFAVHWAHRAKQYFPDGQLYLDLRGFEAGNSPTAPSDALRVLLSSLGISAEYLPHGLDAAAAMYRSILSGRRVLIVLDNARDAEQIRPLLPGSPGCLVLATSRNPLSDLAMTHGARLLTLHLPSRLAAREALERALGSSRVAAEPTAVEEIIRLCGRLPLALAIASARGVSRPAFPLASIADGLRNAHRRLDGFRAASGAPDARTVFSGSYRCLSPQARRLFRLLSSCTAGDLTDTVAAGLLGVRPEKAIQLIAELTDTSLLEEYRPGRYRFHALIRAYATELSDIGDATPEHVPVRHVGFAPAAS